MLSLNFVFISLLVNETRIAIQEYQGSRIAKLTLWLKFGIFVVLSSLLTLVLLPVFWVRYAWITRGQIS